MEPIFPEYSFGSVNLPVWQNNVIRRFSEHKKYRVLLWEFGPTLLDHLHRVKEGKSPDYTKSGLVLTYSIASIVLFVSFASTRRATFTAAVTSGVILLGMVTTVAVDYHKTKRQDNTSQECCLGLLEALGNTPQYWWWPWSKKIKDVELTKEQWERAVNYDKYSFMWRLVLSLFTNVIVHQWYIVQHGYIYNYQQLTKEGCMLDAGKKVLGAGATALGAGVTISIAGIITAHSYFTGRHAEEVGTLAIADKFSNLIRAVILSNNIDNDSSITLNKALESFELKWLLMRLDMSLKDVEEGKKSKEEHNRYAKDRINDVKRLSLKYHPDVQAGIQNANSVQQKINAILKALNSVHDYVMKEKQGYGYIYRLFGEVSINLINSGQDLFKIINIAACGKLHEIAYWEEGRLMEARNHCLEEARERYIKLLKNNLGFVKKILNKEMSIREARNILDSTKEIKKQFEQRNEEYQKFYEEIWVENLKSLSKECKNSKELEIIKSEVDKLLKESEAQHKILKNNKTDKAKADEVFVQPMLEYSDLINMYYKMTIKLCKNIESCFCWDGSFNSNFFKQQKFVLGEDETQFTEMSKQYIKELSHQELFKFTDLMVNYYYSKENGKELQEIIDQYYIRYQNNKPKREEIGNVLVFALNQLANLLEERFKKKETFFEKEKIRTMKAKEESEAINKSIEEIEAKNRALEQSVEQEAQAKQSAEQKAEQEAQARQSAERKAEQEAQARQSAERKAKQLEQALERKNLEKVAIRACNRKLAKLDDELQDAINEESENKVVEAAMSYTRGSPEQVIDAIIEEIKINREQIIKEGRVSAEIIEAGIRSFSNQGTSLSDVNVSHGACAGMGRNSGAGT